MGDWMVPTMDKIFNTTMKFEEDPMSLSINEAYDVATSTVDIFFKNRDTCQFSKVYDDYKTWCVNNLDECVGSDEGFLERIYNHGPDLFAAFYDLAGVMFFSFNDCNTDAEYIQNHSKIVSDVASIGSAIIGFKADYNVKNAHISEESFQESVQKYFDDIYANMTSAIDYDYGFEDNSLDSSFDLGFNFFNNFAPIDDEVEFSVPEWKMPEMPEWKQPVWDTPETPEMPQFDFPDFPKFKFW